VSHEAFNSYCYISSTFTLPAESLNEMYPGVKPHSVKNGEEENVVHHNYYQWVSYLLFIQSLR
jgi:hypothetical protein